MIDRPVDGDEDGPIGGPDPEEDWWMAEDHEPETCPHCGKECEDFADLGCEYCDRRHPGFDALPY